MRLSAFAEDTTMTAVTLHEGLKYIDKNAFYNCRNIGELYLPASLDSIHSEAFTFMYGVNKVTIADSDQPLAFNHTRYYGNGAFNEMPLTTSLYIGRDLAVTDSAVSPIYDKRTVNTITLGEDVTSILDRQFYNNNGLRNLTVNAVEPPACPANAFADVNIDNITLTVPAASRPKYRNAPVWELFFDDEDVPGDVNGDGFVTSADVTAIYNYLLNDEEISSAADLNGDGVITSADITALYNILLQQ